MGRLGRAVAFVIVALIAIEQFPLVSRANAEEPPRIFTDDFSLQSTEILQLNPTLDPNGTCTQGFASGYGNGGFNQTPLVEHRTVTTALGPFIGHRVQIRFTFVTGDARYNHHEGWFVDNIVVKSGDRPLLSDKVESGAGEWSTIGGDGYAAPGWHITSRRSLQSGTYSWWYGRETPGTYEGVPDPTDADNCSDTSNSGALTSKVITLGENPQLEFDTLWQIESVDPQGFDFMRVYIEDLGIAPTDLEVSKTATPSTSVPVGAPVSYQITVSNVGTTPAPGVVVGDTLPLGVTLVSAVPSQGTCGVDFESFTFACELGFLSAPGDGTASATVTAIVVPTTPGEKANTVTAWSEATDPNPANDTATIVTQVTSPPAVNINGSCPHETWLDPQQMTGVEVTLTLKCSDFWLKVAGGAQQQLSIRLKDAPPDYRIAVFRDLAAIALEWRNKAAAAGTPQQLASQLSGISGAPWDAGPWDAGPWDAGPWDAGPWDAGSGGAAPWDAGPWDAGPWDAGPWDAGPWDAGPWDAGADTAATYSIAQMIGLMAVSATGEIVGNTWNYAGDFYIRVWSIKAAPVERDVNVSASFTNTCGSATPLVKSAPSIGSIAATPRTLIFTHTGRITRDDGTALNEDETSQLLGQLNVYAGRPEVAPAVVVDLKNVAGMAANYAQWDSKKDCVQAANIIAEAIHDIIERYRAAGGGTLEYIQIAGGDNAVPYVRMPDTAEIYGEVNYNPGVIDASVSRPPFGLNYLLSQDYYASFTPIAKANHTFYPPDVGIARLVETFEDMLAAIGTYVSVNGVLPNTYGSGTSTDALVVGHTFLADLADFQNGELTQSGYPTESLISDNWTRADFLAKFTAGKRYGFLGIHSHFAANAMLAADSKAIVGSTEFAPLIAAQQPGAFVMSNGCHAGYNILKGDALAATQEKDFPQIFLRNGAGGLLASTTYAYGDTDFMGYTEDVLAKTTRRLRYGNAGDRMVVSTAVTGAKWDHVTEIVAVTGVDEKAVAALTQYGLVTYAINFPSGRLGTPPVDDGLAPVLPADADGIAKTPLTPGFALTAATALLAPGVSASYFTLDDLGTAGTIEENVALIPSRPVLPLYRKKVGSTTPGYRATTAVLRTADFTETAGVRALFSQALTERGNLRPYAATVGFLPSVPFALHHRGAATFDFTPAQLLCGVTSDLCVQRKYTNGTFTIYYSNKTGLDALRGPLSIPRVEATATGPNSFRTIVRVGGTDGVKELLITYTDTAALSGRKWESVSLVASGDSLPCDSAIPFVNLTPTVPAPGTGFLREYVCDITVPGVNALDIQFFVQAVSNGGFGSIRTGGRGFMPSAPRPKIGTNLEFVAAPLTATYDSRRRFSVKLTDTFGQLLVGRDITFALGGASVLATTGVDGVASTVVPIIVEPRATSYDVSARFDGDSDNDGKTAVRQLSVGQAPTEFIALTAVPINVAQTDAVLVARLQASVLDDGPTPPVTHKKRMNEVPVFIRETTLDRASRTNASGDVIVQPNVHDLAAGSVTLFYAGSLRYGFTTSNFAIECIACVLNIAPTVTILGPVDPVAINTAAPFTGTFTDPDDNSHVAQWFWGDGTVSPISLNETLRTFTGSHIYSSPGVYEVYVRISDPNGASGTNAFRYVVVYDPNGGFATGAGWITSPPGACREPSICVDTPGRANFGFVAKYNPGNQSVGGETEFHFQTGNLKFKSSLYDPTSLVIATSKAQYTGSGTINGAGNYGFKVIATDGQYKGGTQPDKFRIIIWTKNADGSREKVIYDNLVGATDEALGSGTELGGGNIVIHTK